MKRKRVTAISRGNDVDNTANNHEEVYVKRSVELRGAKIKEVQRYKLQKKIEEMQQHGPVKVLWKDGKPAIKDEGKL